MLLGIPVWSGMALVALGASSGALSVVWNNFEFCAFYGENRNKTGSSHFEEWRPNL